MGDFGDKQGTRCGSPGHAETEDDAGDEEHVEVDGTGLQADTKKNDEGAADDGWLTSDVIAHIRDERQGEETTEGHGRTEHAELDTCGMAKVILPVWQRLQTVHHGAVEAIGDVDENEEEAVHVKETQVTDASPFGTRILAAGEKVVTFLGLHRLGAIGGFGTPRHDGREHVCLGGEGGRRAKRRLKRMLSGVVMALKRRRETSGSLVRKCGGDGDLYVYTIRILYGVRSTAH